MVLSLSPTVPHIQRPRLTPFLKGVTGYPDDYWGTALDGTATDNIHNHLMGQR